nr:uncharacterized mitochondrial protein AtMg00810-like [Tanacetum cinerariifolium]
MVEKSKLDEDPQRKTVDPTCHHGMIGTFMYLTSSRLDLVFVVCMCARYQVKPTEKHLHAVKRIFQYLRGTINIGLWYSKDSCIALTAFTNVDHAGCKDTKKSTFGSMQLLGDRLVSWSSKKQKSTAISSTEAEYIALIMLWLLPDNQVEIGKCSMRIDPEITLNEPTYQAVLDTLALTTYYLAFLITTYFAFATGEATPNPKRIYKKTASPTVKKINKSPKETPSKKKTLPAKKYKKKAPVTIDNNKGIELLSEAALLEDAQMKKDLKKRKHDTNIHQVSGSIEGADFESMVLDKPKGKDDKEIDDVSDDDGNDDDSDNDDSDNDSDDVRTWSNDDKNDDDQEKEYEEEYVHSPENYESTDDEDEHVDEEEYEELYKDVNVRLKDVEQGKEGKGDAEKTDICLADVTQETTYEQIKDDEHVALTTIHNTQKTESYTTDLEKKDQAERKRYIDLVEKSVKDIINNKVKTKLPQILPKAVPDFTTRVSNSITIESLEDVFLAKSSSQPQSMYEAAKSLTDFELKKIMIDKMEKSKSNLTADVHKILYTALVNSYNVDKDLFEVYDKVVSLKRGHEDKDKDEDPPARSDKGMKSRKKIKDDAPSIGLKSKESKSNLSKGTKSQPKSSGKSAQAEESVFENNHKGKEYPFDLSKLLPLIMNQGRQVVPIDYFINNDLEYLRGGSSSKKYTASTTKTKATKYDILEHQSDTKVLTMTMKILLEPTSNTLCGSDEVLKLKNFKKDGYSIFQDQERMSSMVRVVMCGGCQAAEMVVEHCVTSYLVGILPFLLIDLMVDAITRISQMAKIQDLRTT